MHLGLEIRVRNKEYCSILVPCMKHKTHPRYLGLRVRWVDYQPSIYFLPESCAIMNLTKKSTSLRSRSFQTNERKTKTKSQDKAYSNLTLQTALEKHSRVVCKHTSTLQGIEARLPAPNLRKCPSSDPVCRTGSSCGILANKYHPGICAIGLLDENL